MSREIDNTGKVIVCDDIVATSRRKTQSGVDDVLSQLNGSSAFTAGQKQFSKDFSLSLSGNFKATGSVPATLKLEIYRNGTKLDVSNPAIKGSSILWESLDGTFRRFGEYTAVYEQSISLSDLASNTEQFKVTWTSRDSDSVPLTASVNVSVGEKVEYALSKYLDSSKVATDSIVWFDTISGALGVSHPYSCYLWTRSSSTYDFVNKEYVDWKYFKGELYYEGKTVDDTAGDMIDRLNKYIEFSSSSDRFTVDHKSIGSDTLRFEVNVNGYSNVSYLWNNNAGLIVDESKKTEPKFTVSIPHDNNYDSVVVFVTVTYTDEGETKTIRHDFELTPINVTKPESYLGVLDSIPSGDYIATTGSRAIAGDWFVLKSTNTMYVLDLSYTDSETGSHWKPFTGDMDSSWPLEKVADAMFDMIEIGNTSNTNATMIGVFKALCANSAFIKFLKTRNLTVESSNGNFKFHVKTTNDYGEDLVNPIVEVWYNGTIIFKINPENGNIFFGTPNSDYTAPASGFMYKASDQCIISAGSNVVINSAGTITAKECYFENADISGVLSSVSGLFKGNFDTPSITSMPNTSGGTTFSKYIPARSSESDKSQYAAITSFFDQFNLSTLYCSLSVNANVKMVSKIKYSSYTYQFIFKDENGNQIYYTRANQRSMTSSPWFEGNLPATDISTIFGAGNTLILKDIQEGSAGLKSGQVYKNSSGALYIVP